MGCAPSRYAACMGRSRRQVVRAWTAAFAMSAIGLIAAYHAAPARSRPSWVAMMVGAGFFSTRGGRSSRRPSRAEVSWSVIPSESSSSRGWRCITDSWRPPAGVFLGPAPSRRPRSCSPSTFDGSHRARQADVRAARAPVVVSRLGVGCGGRGRRVRASRRGFFTDASGWSGLHAQGRLAAALIASGLPGLSRGRMRGAEPVTGMMASLMRRGARGRRRPLRPHVARPRGGDPGAHDGPRRHRRSEGRDPTRRRVSGRETCRSTARGERGPRSPASGARP